MKKIFNSFIPFKGYTALTTIPFIFIRKDREKYFDHRAERHEYTHVYQQIEVLLLSIIIACVAVMLGATAWLLIIPPFTFYIIYLLEWLLKLPFCKFDRNKAYRSISTEQEAFGHELDCEYNGRRKPFAWIIFIFKIVKI